MLRKVRFRVANRDLTARIDREGDWYVALCLEVDDASQGKSADEALANLREAVELHFEVV
jgi:predicted RNase H-like HicB family nuclease